MVNCNELVKRYRYQLLIAVSLACTLTACAAENPDHSEIIKMEESQDVVTVIIAKYSEQLMLLEGVVAVGESICNETPCIKVLLSKSNPQTLAAIPQHIEGHQCRNGNQW